MDKTAMLVTEDSDRRQKLLSGIGLMQIFGAVKGDNCLNWIQKDAEAVMFEDHSCFLCFEKDRILKSLRMKISENCGKQTSEGLDSNGKLHTSTDVGSPSSTANDLLNLIKDVCTSHDAVDDVEKEHESDDSATSLSAKVKQLYTAIAENLLTFDGDPVEVDAAAVTSAKTADLQTFAVRTPLSQEQIKSHGVLSCFCECLQSDGDESNVVAFKVCKSCLDAVFFDLHDAVPNRTFSAAELLNHVVSMLYVSATECLEVEEVPANSSVDAAPISPVDDAEIGKSPERLTGSDDVSVEATEVDDRQNESIAEVAAQSLTDKVLEPVGAKLPAGDGKEVQRPLRALRVNGEDHTGRDLDAGVVMAPVPCVATKGFVKLPAKAFIRINNTIALVTNGQVKSLPVRNRENVRTRRPCVKLLPKTVLGGTQNGAKMSLLKPGVLNNITFVKVKPQKVQPTVSKVAKARMKPGQFVLKVPSATTRDIVVTGNNQPVMCQTASGAKKSVCSFVRSNVLLPLSKSGVVKQPLPATSDGSAISPFANVPLKSVSVKQTVTLTGSVLRSTSVTTLPKVAQVDAPASPSSDSAPKKAKTKHKDVINLIVNTSKEDGASSPVKSTKPRTPSKRKRTESGRGPPMKKIVASYLNDTQQEEDSSQKTGSLTRRSASAAGNAAVKKVIPIPYETHYLCIQDTLSKKGWKAYWYRKCRCARTSGRLTKTGSKAPHCGPSTSQQSEQLGDESLPGVEIVFSSSILNSPCKDSTPSCVDSSHCVKKLDGLENMAADGDGRSTEGSDDFACDVETEPDESEPTSGAPTRLNNIRSAIDEEEMALRRAKVASVSDAILQAGSIASNASISKSLRRPVVFAQSFEPVDKQPARLDLIAVRKHYFSHVAAFEDLFRPNCGEAKHAETLLAKCKPNGAVASGMSSGEDPDLKVVWSYGKHKSFFDVKKKKKFTKTFVRRRVFKRSAMKTNALNIRRRLVGFKRKPRIPVKKAQLLRDPTFNRNADLIIWNVPKTSVSAVVNSLESLWGEELDLEACLKRTKYDDTRPYGAVTISAEQIELALSALRKDDEIFTFSSKRVKARKGQKTVLLISRKYLDAPMHCMSANEKDEAEAEAAAVEMPSVQPVAEPSEAKPDREGCALAPSPSKILLKLKKVYASDNPDQVMYTTNGDVCLGEEKNELAPEEQSATQQTEPCLGPVAHKTETSEPNPPKIAEELLFSNPTRDLDLPETHLVDEIDTEVEASETMLPLDLPVTDISNDDFSETSAKQLPGSDGLALNHSEIGDAERVKETTDSVHQDDESFDCLSSAAPGEETASGEDAVEDLQRKRLFSGEWQTPPGSPVRIEKLEPLLPPESPEIFHCGAAVDTSTPQAASRADSLALNESALANVTEAVEEMPSVVDEPDTIGYKIEDWDHDVFHGEFDQFLSKVTENSLDLLELVLLSFKPEFIPPLQLLITMQNTESKIENAATSVVRLTEDERNVDNWEQVAPSDSVARWLPQSFDSPEAVRGVSQSTLNDPQVAPMSPTDSDAEFQGSPVSPNTAERPNGQARGRQDSPGPEQNTVMKACNVVIEPLSNVSQSREPVDSSHTTDGDGRSRSENLRAAYMRMLKNHALNGAYWKIPSTPSDSSVYGDDGATQWYLRDRTKRIQSDEEEEEKDHDVEVGPDAENEEASSESNESDQIEESCGPKRKRLGRSRYCHLSVEPSASDTPRVESGALTNWETDSSELQQNISKKSGHFPLLINSDVDLEQVKRWMYANTETQPRPFILRFLVAKRAAIRASQAKPRSRGQRDSLRHPSTSSTVASCNDDGKETNSYKTDARKSKADSSPTRRSISNVLADPEFDATRKHLFRLRHPNYRGRLVQSDDVISDVDTDDLTGRPYLRLLRVREADARKTDTSSLTSDLIHEDQRLKRKSCFGLGSPHERDQSSGKRMRAFAPCQTPPSDVDFDSAAPEMADGTDRGDSVTSSDYFEPPGNLRRAGSLGRGARRHKARRALRGALNAARGRLVPAYGSRGRGARRGRPPKRLAANDRNTFITEEQDEASANSVRGGRGRFSNKHSTCGSFLLRVLESGSIDDYLS